ncbi:hypothetical protein HDU92_001374 [Lobulomyces angularis]|nr:hypothetical protein HDU92_001374 [Lobulomyces angularis]
MYDFSNWDENLNHLKNTPYPFITTKTVLFTQKTKSYLFITKNQNQLKLSDIANKIQKGARIANKEKIQTIFANADPDHLSIFDVQTLENKSNLKVFVDEELLSEKDAFLAFRLNESESCFLSVKDFTSFLSEDLLGGFENLNIECSDEISTKNYNSQKKKKEDNESEPTATPSSGKETKIGLEVKKDEDFSTWYTQVLTRTEMLEYYDISGCYILRPWSFKIWKIIQQFFGGEIEELGVEDCYFPMFVTASALNKEKDHVEGFAPEVAWVTKAGDSDLAEPIAIRPTSEVVMYPSYANWIRSHRDLPLRLNQWCNVVRWEFKHPQPFLRTREFLWQEGHTAFATREEAEEEVFLILDLYRRVYEEFLAVPVIPGKKSEKERFPGGLMTTTVEGFIPTTGRAIQGGTSHCLGQNFSKMFNILIENENRDRVHVWQNSWGLSTRTIGAMVMVHGDDKGLVLPPKVAALQCVIIPVGMTSKIKESEKKVLLDKVNEVFLELKKKHGLRVKADIRDNCTSGFKFNHWELKGVPLRLEIGPKDLANNSMRVVRRDNGDVSSISLSKLADVQILLDKIQQEMYNRAKEVRDSRLVRLETWDKFVETLDEKCMVLAPWCEEMACEDDVKERSARVSSDEKQDDKAPSMGAKTLCIPLEQPKERPLKPGKTKCFACKKNAKSYTLWGRSY